MGAPFYLMLLSFIQTPTVIIIIIITLVLVVLLVTLDALLLKFFLIVGVYIVSLVVAAVGLD